MGTQDGRRALAKCHEKRERPALFSLERAQEIDDFLLLLSSQPIEMFDDLICLATTALVISDGVHEVGRPSWRKKTRCPTPQRGAVRNSS